MTQARSSTLLFVFLLVAGGGGAAAWFAVGMDDGAADPVAITPHLPEPEPEVASIGAPELEQPPGRVDPEAAFATTVDSPLRLTLSLVQRAAFEKRDDIVAPGSGAAARLRGFVGGMAGAGVQATVTFVGGPNEGRVLYCDAEGRYHAGNLYPGLSIAVIETPTGRKAMREVRLRKHTEAVLSVAFARPATVYGMVKDRSGAPLEGATVMMDGRRTFTDDLGEFYFPEMASGKALTIVEKPGYARYREIVPIPAARVVTKDTLEFHLDLGASLEVSIQENIGSREPALLFLFPGGGQRVNTARGQRTYPWHLVSPVEIYPGGTALIEGLPEGRVYLALFHSGAIAEPRQQVVKLNAGERTAKILHITPAPQIRGRVVREGLPVRDARVVLEAPNLIDASLKAVQRPPGFEETMVFPHLPAGLQRVRTDVEGRFVFTSFPGVSAAFYLAAVSPDEMWRGDLVVQSGETNAVVELKRVPEVLASLTVGMKGRYQGLPVRIWVEGRARDPLVLPGNQELTVDGLESGTWRVEASFEGKPVLEGKLVVLVGNEAGFVPLVLPPRALHGPR